MNVFLSPQAKNLVVGGSYADSDPAAPDPSSLRETVTIKARVTEH